jgi:hypothetical protein
MQDLETQFVDLGGGLMRLQRFAYRGVIEFPQHTHDELSIVFCMGGVIESSQFGARETMRKGDVLITNRRVRHSSRYLCEGGISSGLTIELGREMQRRFGLEGKLLMGCLRLERVEQVASDLLRELDEEKTHTETMRMALAQELIVRVVRGWPPELVRAGSAEDLDLLTRREFVETTAALQRSDAGHEGKWQDEDFVRRFWNTTGVGRNEFVHQFGRMS